MENSLKFRSVSLRIKQSIQPLAQLVRNFFNASLQRGSLSTKIKISAGVIEKLHIQALSTTHGRAQIICRSYQADLLIKLLQKLLCHNS